MAGERRPSGSGMPNGVLGRGCVGATGRREEHGRDIGHWCLVTQMVEEGPEVKRNNGRVLHVSPIASKLLQDEGWDPFLEDDASLWLIHWLLVSNPRIGTSWQVAFSLFQRPDFTKHELIDYSIAFAEKQSVDVKEGSLARDVDCFLRTYTPAKTTAKQKLAEETFDCPLQELNIIDLSPDGELYRFAIGAKPSLPAAVFGYAFAQYFEPLVRVETPWRAGFCTDGKPGQVFKLDENSLIEYIEDLEKTTREESRSMKQQA